MIKIIVELKELENEYVDIVLEIKDSEPTDSENLICDDIVDTLNYLINGDEVEDVTNEITENMLNQHKEG